MTEKNCINCFYGDAKKQVCNSPEVCNEYKHWKPRPRRDQMAEFLAEVAKDREELQRYRDGLEALHKRSIKMAFQYGDLGGACYGALRLVISGGGRNKKAIDEWFEEHDE